MKYPVPDGDVLVHAGDLTNTGKYVELLHVVDWMKNLPHEHKLIVCGNHELEVSGDTQLVKDIFEKDGIRVIHDEVVDIDGVKFYGQPRTPEFFDWGWMYRRGFEANQIWSGLPEGIDVVVCHGPPFGYGDVCPDYTNRHKGTSASLVHVGCAEQAQRLSEVKPSFVVCGHVHFSYGPHATPWGTVVVNSSICTERYEPSNRPPVINFDKETRKGTVDFE